MVKVVTFQPSYSAIITSAEVIIAGGQIFKTAASRFVNRELTNQRLLHDGAVGSPHGPAPSSCSILNLRFTVKTTTIMRDQ